MMMNLYKNYNININNVVLVRTAFDKNQLISDDLPKVIFIGRSNVGKSSLLNKILNRKRLAKTSSRPGKTVSINYYLVSEEFYFVDLPGYGYAKVSKKETERVKRLMASFFSDVTSVKLVILLLDCRRGFQNSDLEFVSMVVEKKFKMLTILTKSDKLSTSELKNQQKKLKTKYDLNVIPFTVKSINDKESVLESIFKSIKE